MEVEIENAIDTLSSAIRLAMKKLKAERDATGDDAVEPTALKLALCKKIDVLRVTRTALEDVALL